MPRPRQPGRHRRPEPPAAPDGAPALVLAVPGTPCQEVRHLVDEVIYIARSELPGLNAVAGYLEDSDPARQAEEEFPHEYPALAEVLADAGQRWAEAAERAEREAARARTEEAGDGQEAPEEAPVPRFSGPAAVVVPLLAGPEAGLQERVRGAIAASGVRAELTDVLGPHPLLAEAVHVRLSEAGLARADRARLFTVATAADGIILATVGGPEAVAAAGVTGLLLAARLAVPVLAAGLDVEGAVAGTAEQLRSSGSQRLALAPYAIGPELPAGLLASACEAAACDAAEPVGAYPGIGKLVLSKYLTLLGIAPQQPQHAPAR